MRIEVEIWLINYWHTKKGLLKMSQHNRVNYQRQPLRVTDFDHGLTDPLWPAIRRRKFCLITITGQVI